MKSILDRKVVLVGGKGGVGKPQSRHLLPCSPLSKVNTFLLFQRIQHTVSRTLLM